MELAGSDLLVRMRSLTFLARHTGKRKTNDESVIFIHQKPLTTAKKPKASSERVSSSDDEDQQAKSDVI